MKNRMKVASKLIRILLVGSGCFFLLLCVLAFTTLPFYARYWLGTHKGFIDREPAAIVLMGGSGMPSEDGLIRCYYTATLANRYLNCPIIIAMPGDTTDSLSSPCLMRKELNLHGIGLSRIYFENNGKNTRQQALKIEEMKSSMEDTGMLAIVTAPEHMYRSIRSFEKAGFKHVRGLPTFEQSIAEKDLYYNDRDLKGNHALPAVGHNKQVRYQFWNHLKFEILVIREYFALGYYKIRGWI
jgi:uncharacterized SAM-binding protein YcdF (DUF218 family)